MNELKKYYFNFNSSKLENPEKYFKFAAIRTKESNFIVIGIFYKLDISTG